MSTSSSPSSTPQRNCAQPSSRSPPEMEGEMVATEIGGLGRSVKRKEDPRFIRGKGTYVDDVTLPGMLFLDIARSPYAHARITRIDKEPALAVPGVLAVITGADLDAAGLAWMPTLM